MGDPWKIDHLPVGDGRFWPLFPPEYYIEFTWNETQTTGGTGVRISHLPPGDDIFLTDLPSPTGRQTSFQWISHLPMGDRQIYLNLPSPSVKWLNSFLHTQTLVRIRADTSPFIIFYFESTFYPFYLLQSRLPRNEAIKDNLQDRYINPTSANHISSFHKEGLGINFHKLLGCFKVTAS